MGTSTRHELVEQESASSCVVIDYLDARANFRRTMRTLELDYPSCHHGSNLTSSIGRMQIARTESFYFRTKPLQVRSSSPGMTPWLTPSTHVAVFMTMVMKNHSSFNAGNADAVECRQASRGGTSPPT